MGVAELNQIDLQALARGDKRTWDAFVAAAAPLINAVVRRTLSSYRLGEDDVMDAAQDVFVRLCAQDFRLLKTYDPARAGLPTWLAVVSRSCAIDLLRRRRQAVLDEGALQVLVAQRDHRGQRSGAADAAGFAMF